MRKSGPRRARRARRACIDSLLLLALVALAVDPLGAAKGEDEPAAPPAFAGRYTAFDVLREAEAERWLSEAHEAGYVLRDFRGGFRSGWTVGGYAGLLVRGDGPPVEMFIRDKPDWIEDGLNDAVGRGLRLRHGSLFSQDRGAAPFQDTEFVGLLEPAAEGAGQSHYRVLFGENLEQNLPVVARQGYDVVGFVAARDQPVVVLEIVFHPEGLPERPEEPYRLLEVGTARALRKRLEGAATEGFRLVGAAAPGGDRFYLLENTGETAEYRFPRGKDRMAALNVEAARGFRVLPFTWEPVLVMERLPGAADPVSYRLIGGTDRDDVDLAAWSAEIEKAVAAGARILRLTAPYQVLVEQP